jgi:ATP-dependent DNA ligase
MTTLYIRDNKGALRQWSIFAEEHGLQIEHGLVEGATQSKFEYVPAGKVNRSLQEQIELQKQSRINRMLDKGYVLDIDEAWQQQPRNRLGFVKPMLAQKIADVTVDYTDAFIQRKYDGNRCLITNTGQEVIAYSRNGKQITTIDHILSSVTLLPGDTIDGELYCHGETLQTIVSWAKRKQEATKWLKFVAYDMVSDRPFIERLEALHDIPRVAEICEIALTYPVKTNQDTIDYFELFRKEGYEGAMIRWGNMPYEDGKRSKSLLKIKEWLDAEFLVVNITASKDGWAVLKCKMPSGKTFDVSAPGTMYERRYIIDNPQQYLNKTICVNYAYITADGLPFHPVATHWAS